MNFNDLSKLIKEKDSSGVGKINYQDFCKWLGTAIHMSESFVFRHDSQKNPQFDLNAARDEKTKGIDKRAAQQSLLKGDNETKIIEKIKTQWKTMRKAFMDLNMEKSGKISKKEFKFFLNFWGMEISDKDCD